MQISRLVGIVMAVAVPAVTIAAVEGLTTFSPGDPIRAAEINDNFERLADALSTRHISVDQEMQVESCPQLQAELLALSAKTIAPNVRVILTIAAGEHQCETIGVYHPNSDRITIRGGGVSSADTLLRFTGGGLLLERGGGLGSLTNLTLVGPASGNPSTNRDGIRLSSGASLAVSDVVVREFRDGIVSEQAASIAAIRVVVRNNARCGFGVYEAGTALLRDTSAVDNGSHGYWAHSRGFIAVTSSSPGAAVATATGNGGTGFRATVGGMIYGYGTLAGSENAEFIVPELNTLGADGSYVHE